MLILIQEDRLTMMPVFQKQSDPRVDLKVSLQIQEESGEVWTRSLKWLFVT